MRPSMQPPSSEEANFPPTVYTTLLLLLLRLACNRRHYSSHSRYTWILLRALTFSTDSDSMKNLLAIAVVTFFWVPRHETPLQGILQIIFHRTTCLGNQPGNDDHIAIAKNLTRLLSKIYHPRRTCSSLPAGFDSVCVGLSKSIVATANCRLPGLCLLLQHHG